MPPIASVEKSVLTPILRPRASPAGSVNGEAGQQGVRDGRSPGSWPGPGRKPNFHFGYVHRQTTDLSSLRFDLRLLRQNGEEIRSLRDRENRVARFSALREATRS